MCVHSDVKVELAGRRLSSMFILGTGLQEIRRKTPGAGTFVLAVEMDVLLLIEMRLSSVLETTARQEKMTKVCPLMVSRIRDGHKPHDCVNAKRTLDTLLELPRERL